jgi:hypothetical protein
MPIVLQARAVYLLRLRSRETQNKVGIELAYSLICFILTLDKVAICR